MTEIEQVKLENVELRKILQSIIDGCVHPDIAVRAVFVELEPIRKVLGKQMNSK